MHIRLQLTWLPARLSLGRRTGAAGALAIAALGATIGCAGSGGSTAPKHDRAPASADAPDRGASVARRAEQAPVDHEAYAKLGYRLSWRGFPVMTDGAHVTHFELLGDAIAVQESGNTVTLMETTTGRNRWASVVGQPLTRFVGMGLHDKHVLVSSDNELFVLDLQTGDVLDRQRLAAVVNTGPIVSKNVAVFGSATGEVLGHSLVTRFKKWGYLLKGSIVAVPARVGDNVGVVSQSGDVIVIDPGSGGSTMKAHIFSGLANNPVGSESTIFVAGLDQSVYAFEAAGGRTLWRYRTEQPITDQPVVQGARLYVAIPGEGLVAFDAGTGSPAWSTKGVRGLVVGLRDGRLIVWDGGEAVTLDPERGDVIDRVRLPGIAMLRMSKFDNGDLYTVTPSGVVAKFTPKI